MKKNHLSFGLVTAAIFLKIFLFVFITLNAPSAKFEPDSYEYLRTTSMLKEKGVFAYQDASGTVQSEVWRTPGYPLFIAGLHNGMGLPLDGVVFVQVLLTILAAWIVFKTALLIDEKTAFLSGLIVLFDPTISVISLRIMSEALYLFLLALFFLYFTQYLKSPKMKPLLLAALILVIATYVRPVSYYVGLMASFFIICSNAPGNRKAAVFHALVFLGVVYALLILWHIRNYMCCGETSFTTVVSANFNEKGLFDKHFVVKEASIAGWLAAAGRFLFTGVYSIFKILLRPVSFRYFGSEFLRYAGCILSYPWTIFWFGGFLAGLSQLRSNIYFRFFLLIILYFSIIPVLNLGTVQEARYRIPIMPCFAIMAASGWAFLWPRIRGYGFPSKFIPGSR
jgi:hypothetical protein